MDSKKLIWGGMIIGSYVGGLIPNIWGQGYFSMSGLIFSALGGILGIYLGFKISR